MKRVLAGIMLICMLLTVGCGSRSTNIRADEKPIEVKDVTLENVVTSYVAKGLTGFKDVNYSGMSNVPIIGNNIYMLAGDGEKHYIYRANIDGSDPVIISQQSDKDKVWQTMTAFNGKLYVRVYPYRDNREELREYDTDGNLLRTISLPDNFWSFPTMEGGEKYLYAFDIGEGKLIAIDPDSEDIVAFTVETASQGSLGKLADGRVLIAEEMEGGTRISVIDEENRCLGESRYIDISCELEGYARDQSIYLQAGKDIYIFDFGTAALEKLFSLNSVGLENHGRLHDCQNGTFIHTMSLRGSLDKPTLIYEVEIPADAKPLVLATVNGLNGAVQQIILRWNAQHPECRVTVKDYSVYNTESDLSLAQQKLVTDIGAGEIPDLYDLSIGDASLNTPMLVRRGLLEDLYPYLDADPELDRSDFLSGPLKAMELNGGLYQAQSAFILFTSMAAAADVGSPEEWTYAGLERKMTESGKYHRLSSDMNDPANWLREVVEASGNRLIDWEKGECRFDSEYFVRLLELSKDAAAVDTEGEVRASALAEESGALLFQLTSMSVWEGEMGAQIYGAGNYAFVGYPEVGAAVYPQSSVGMSAHSENKEMCWQFVREFFMKYSMNGFPMRCDEIEEDYERECRHEYVDEAQKQSMRDFIAHAESASVCYRPDDALWSIIKAELNKFYAGQNTAEQTAKAIQSKASIYIAEQS